MAQTLHGQRIAHVDPYTPQFLASQKLLELSRMRDINFETHLQTMKKARIGLMRLERK